jgi:hypothetical protein
MEMKDSKSNLQNGFFEILSRGFPQRLSRVPQCSFSQRREIGLKRGALFVHPVSASARIEATLSCCFVSSQALTPWFASTILLPQGRSPCPMSLIILHDADFCHLSNWVFGTQNTSRKCTEMTRKTLRSSKIYIKFSVMSTEPGKKKRILYSFLLSWLLRYISS